MNLSIAEEKELCLIKREDFFRLQSQFPGYFDFISRFGTLWVEVFMTREEKNEINFRHPNSVVYA